MRIARSIIDGHARYRRRARWVAASGATVLVAVIVGVILLIVVI